MLLLTGLAAATTLSGPGATLQVALEAEDGTLLATFYAADNLNHRVLGWRPDLASRQDWIEIELPELALTPGRYRLVASWPGAQEEQWIVQGTPEGDPVLVVLPSQAQGAIAWSMEGDDAWQRLAYADDGRPLYLTPGRWQVAAVGTQRPHVEQLHAPTAQVRLDTPLQPLPRNPSPSGLVGLLLAPAVVLLVATAAGARRLWQQPEAPWLVLAALATAAIGIAAVFPAPGTVLLSAGGVIGDPEDSVALLATMIDALRQWSDVGRAYAWPEGASWLTVGPSWLGYLPAGVIGAMTEPVTGHNLGIGLGLAGIALAVSLLTRSHGLRLPLAIAAGAAAALCPAVIDEVDAISLDRATLYTAPLALLCLHRAVTRAGRGWAIAAGLSIAAGVYGQVYYGIFFALVSPVLGGLRLLGTVEGGRISGLRRLVLAGVIAIVVAAPGLHALRAGTAGLYDDTAPLTDWRAPVTAEQANAFFSRSDPRILPMETAEQRLLSTASQALSAESAIAPVGFAGGVAWWGLAGLSLLLARRRGLALLCVADVAVLLTLSLGPFLKTAAGWSGIPLPHYLLFLGIPGFDQLKNVHRFALMAAVLAPVPLALGIDGLASRLPRGRRIAEVGLVAVLLATLFRVEDQRIPRLSHPPHVAWYPASAALAGLPSAPAIALPMQHPTPRSIAVLAAQHHIPLVNPPPFEVSRSALSPWAEDNALLNTLAALSANPRVGRILPAADLTADLAALWGAGVRYVVLFPEEMAHHAAVTALLDGLLERAGADPTVTVWHLRPAPPRDR